jgi:enolase
MKIFMETLNEKLIACTAKQISDSRGMATIEVEVSTEVGREIVSAKAAVPSGKSTGSGEAVAVRDADGGVAQAMENVEKKIAPALLGRAINSEDFDHRVLALDITKDKSHIGANAMLGVSMAVMRLEAQLRNRPLWKFISEKSGFPTGKPKLYMNTLNGGVHADFCLPFQEYILAVGGETLRASNEKAKALFEKVKQKLDEKNIDYYVGDEGGFAPRLSAVDEPFQILTDCAGKDPDVFIAIDAAASEFYKKEKDKYEVAGQVLSRGDLLLLYKELVEKFNLRSIEDPFYEKDFIGFEAIKNWIGDALIVADDLTVTNPLLINKYGLRGLATGVIIKPNQIGTMFETFEAIRQARSFGWKIIVSHRSGETMDSFISDLAVGVGAYGIKAGAHTQPERLAKYDRLLEIEKEMDTIQEEERKQKETEEAEKRKRPYY